MVLLAMLAVVIIEQGGASPAQVLVLILTGLGGLVALLVVGFVVVSATEWVGARRQRNLEWRMGPILREWMGKERADDSELKWWRKCERSGVSVQLAREWANDGMPYPL